MTDNAFLKALDRTQPLILDGGLATQLEAQGCDISGVLWSAALLKSNPEAIVAASEAFLDAGADCIATASYQASREGYAQVGIDADEADALMLHSVDLARQTGAAVIAASLGPYGAMLHDGSEYRGDYGVSADILRSFHEPRLALFDAANVDVLALETIPSLIEAEVLVELLDACSTPSWVSFSCCDDAHISDGPPVEDAVRLFARHDKVARRRSLRQRWFGASGIPCQPSLSWRTRTQGKSTMQSAAHGPVR